MDLKDIMISTTIYELLYANGVSDSQHNTNMHTGWQEVATLGGYDPHTRTPAREAYEDGYYSVIKKF